MPLPPREQLGELADGNLVKVRGGTNVLAFGLSGTKRAHALCAWATGCWKWGDWACFLLHANCHRTSWRPGGTLRWRDYCAV